MKTKLIAAAALVAATAGIALIGTSSAATFMLPPKLECYVNFMKTGGYNNDTYTCLKQFHTICRQGLQSGKPILTQLGATSWKVSYGCFKPIP